MVVKKRQPLISCIMSVMSALFPPMLTSMLVGIGRATEVDAGEGEGRGEAEW